MSEKLEKLEVARLKPYQYIHLLNNNTNITTLLVGPLTYTRLDHEYFTTAVPQNFVAIPPQRYCIIENPVQRDSEGDVVIDRYNQAKIRLGDREIRFTQAPFPLYPGEKLVQEVTKLDSYSSTQALHLSCNRDFEDVVNGKKVNRRAGDEWVVVGPLTYIPRIEVDLVRIINATVIGANQALKVRCKSEFFDTRITPNVKRVAGEEYLITAPGGFIPEVTEEVVSLINAYILTERRAIHVTALQNFTDRFGVDRHVGSAWLLTLKEVEQFIPSPQELVLATVDLTVVGKRQYCVVENIYENNKQILGRKELRRGHRSFFLHPGEVLVGGGVIDVHVLGSHEALLLKAEKSLVDDDGVQREAGSRWLIAGPREFVPSVDVEVLNRRAAIPLDKNEGVYIRNSRTGEVRAHIGSTVMLNEDESLWEKAIDPLVEELLNCPRLTKVLSERAGATAIKPREKHMVVSCNVPHNSLVQVFDFKTKKARVVRGPDCVMLQPDEEFTVISLSGGRPKRPDIVKSLALQLGPDFMADTIVIETLDHARLQLELSYNWEFDQSDDVINGKAFTVPDFVGDACKAIASRIRGSVSSETFDAFHRNSSNIIKHAVFGMNHALGQLNKEMLFEANGLKITNVDVHSVDPVDPKTREALTKSVQLAIEITTKSQEAIALQQASASEQQAKGKLERQVIQDKSLSEVERRKLLEIEALNAAIESTGASKAQAKAVAESLLIEGQTEVDLAAKKSEASEISVQTELEIETLKQKAELDHRQALYELEVAKVRGFATIEAEKFKKVIAAVGKDTIKAIARAGPELQVKLLQGLGLQGYLVTDGTNPINLFNTAKGMTAASS